jgi:hypothetical protein
MFTLNNAILLMGVGDKRPDGQCQCRGKRIKLLVLLTPIRLDNNDYVIKATLNKMFETQGSTWTPQI